MEDEFPPFNLGDFPSFFPWDVPSLQVSVAHLPVLHPPEKVVAIRPLHWVSFPVLGFPAGSLWHPDPKKSKAEKRTKHQHPWQRQGRYAIYVKSCWWFRNIAPVEVGSLSHYLQIFDMVVQDFFPSTVCKIYGYYGNCGSLWLWLLEWNVCLPFVHGKVRCNC